MRLRGKVSVVTGGGRGLGKAIALELAREGSALALISRTRAELDRVRGEASVLGVPVEIAVGDVSEPDQARRIVHTAVETFDRIDILVNAAGTYGPIGVMWETDPDGWLEALRVNLMSVFLMCREVVPHMIRAGAGRIINFSGGGATSPLPRFGAYGASKAAVVRLTETLAEELKGTGVQVNAIAPGMVNTRLQDAVLAAGERAGKLLERVSDARATGRGWVPPEVAARLAVFLASPESEGLSGKLISAPHDDWESWDRARIGELMNSPLLALRRLDEFTVRQLSGASDAQPCAPRS